jgi:putative SOS response-associated peptidase YedK
MCYFIDNKKVIEDVEDNLHNEYNDNLSSFVNALNYPVVPIITNKSDNKFVLAKWRFNPNLPDDSKCRTIGLNIDSEKAFSTRMFKEYTFQHCIIPINAFFEWKHFDNHKIKVKHRITFDKENVFYLAGLWRYYDENKVSFGVLTTIANLLMSDIHNSKRRMPISLAKSDAYKYLEAETLYDFQFPQYNPNLVAENIEPFKLPNTLF